MGIAGEGRRRWAAALIRHWRPEPCIEAMGQATAALCRGQAKPPQQQTGNPPLLAAQLASGRISTASTKSLGALVTA